MACCAKRLTIGVVLLTALAGSAGAQADIGGRWRLDSARSTDLENALALHGQRQGFRIQGGSQQVAPGPIPGGSPAGSIRLADGRTVDVNSLAAEARQTMYGGDYFEIVQTDSTVVFSPLNLAHDPATLFVDGKKRKTYFLTDVEGDVKAEWKGDRLKVERWTENVQATEYWLLADDPSFLVVQVEMRGRMFQKKLEIQRVYRRPDS